MIKRFDEETCIPTYNSTAREQELTNKERGLISTSYSYSDKSKLPTCPIEGLVQIDYKKGKRAYIIRKLDPEVIETLKDDKMYGKSTLVHCVFAGKDKETGEPTNRMVSVDMVYFGIRWLRFKKICEEWGVMLNEL